MPKGDVLLAFMAATATALVGMALGTVCVAVLDGRGNALAIGAFVFVFGAPFAVVASVAAYAVYVVARIRRGVSRRTAVGCGLVLGALAAAWLRRPDVSPWAVGVGGLAGWVWWAALVRSVPQGAPSLGSADRVERDTTAVAAAGSP